MATVKIAMGMNTYSDEVSVAGATKSRDGRLSLNFRKRGRAELLRLVVDGDDATALIQLLGRATGSACPPAPARRRRGRAKELAR